MTEESRHIQLTNQIRFRSRSLIKYVQYLLGLTSPTWKVFTDITNYLPHMKKLKLMNHTGTGGLQSFKVNVRPTHLSCRRMHFFITRRDSQPMMPPTQMCRLILIYWKDFAEASLSFTESSQDK